MNMFPYTKHEFRPKTLNHVEFNLIDVQKFRTCTNAACPSLSGSVANLPSVPCVLLIPMGQNDGSQYNSQKLRLEECSFPRILVKCITCVAIFFMPCIAIHFATL